MSYLPNNFDAFQEGIINGGYDPQEQDNHPVAGGDDWMFGWDAEPYEDNPYDGTYSEEQKMDFVIYKSEADDNGRLVELVRNRHCEVYEVIVDGIPVFNCEDYGQAEHEYNMECV